ncbi:FAD:protein FMN transferase [Cellulomonas alba]|uniref:FAD:protein FMN transferase n=1 Tax=Cellulomonas alba TaxID=3053467 RepID=A0ABT7SD88_9CELL|nr:FAD:protein FMN transferase [Cellulomonas alba]MDM7853532.1 FAD:protein FMN transferase [Cellulomonas alba]
MTTTTEAPRRAWTVQVMGMPVSIHVRGGNPHGSQARDAVERAYATLRDVDARFSPFRADSELSRLRRGELTLAAASDDLRLVERLCRTAVERTAGAFDPWRWRDGFDPTGLVKGWAVARAGELLREVDGDVLVDAGGDVLAWSRSGRPWVVGIEDPTDRSRVLARVPLLDGAVATSGPAARGAHIVDPRTGEPAAGVLSATVVGPSILWADVAATTAVVLGPAAEAWTSTLHGTSGLLVLAGGRVHRWANPT